MSRRLRYTVNVRVEFFPTENILQQLALVDAMKTVEAKISENLDRQIDALVEQGWFHSRDKVLREAIRRFLEAHRPELMEHFIRDDVAWGLRGRI